MFHQSYDPPKDRRVFNPLRDFQRRLDIGIADLWQGAVIVQRPRVHAQRGRELLKRASRGSVGPFLVFLHLVAS
ncbi:MAG: hypothetical protein ACRYGP_10420 [Janthinobacterium lividum]